MCFRKGIVSVILNVLLKGFDFVVSNSLLPGGLSLMGRNCNPPANYALRST